jgi:hypothetical protein
MKFVRGFALEIHALKIRALEIRAPNRINCRSGLRAKPAGRYRPAPE